MKSPSKPKILVVTACGRKKHDKPMPAWKLYKSSRIRAVYNRTQCCDYAILSSKYGLVEADREIAPYEQIMTKQRAADLVPQVMMKVKKFDYVVYYRGGARKEYLDCIKEACREAARTLIVLGYANMGGINNLTKVLELLEKNKLRKITYLNHTFVTIQERAKYCHE